MNKKQSNGTGWIHNKLIGYIGIYAVILKSIVMNLTVPITDISITPSFETTSYHVALSNGTAYLL